MYQEPYPTSIWIDSTNRMVRIKNTKSYQHPTKCVDTNNDEADPTPHPPYSTPSRHSQQLGRTISPHSTIMSRSNSVLSVPPEQPYSIDEASILQSLRAVVVRHHASVSPSPTTTTKVILSSKERVLHAVLRKWNVITEQ